MGNYVVTGASSGIGEAIAAALLEKGHFVVGIGRNFDKNTEKLFVQKNSVIIKADLQCIESFDKIEGATANLKTIDGLINAAGVAYYGTHESIDPAKIAEMVDVNIKAPMILTRILLPKIRAAKGTIVNISSITAKKTANTHGVCYGATKAALTSFGESLFEEVRKQGVRVLNVHPDLTETGLYRNADFTPGDNFDERLLPAEIANGVLLALEAREGLAITDITIRPQRNVIKKR